jgi:hypothetical protein
MFFIAPWLGIWIFVEIGSKFADIHLRKIRTPIIIYNGELRIPFSFRWGFVMQEIAQKSDYIICLLCCFSELILFPVSRN